MLASRSPERLKDVIKTYKKGLLSLLLLEERLWRVCSSPPHLLLTSSFSPSFQSLAGNWRKTS